MDDEARLRDAVCGDKWAAFVQHTHAAVAINRALRSPPLVREVTGQWVEPEGGGTAAAVERQAVSILDNLGPARETTIEVGDYVRSKNNPAMHGVVERIGEVYCGRVSHHVRSGDDAWHIGTAALLRKRGDIRVGDVVRLGVGNGQYGVAGIKSGPLGLVCLVDEYGHVRAHPSDCTLVRLADEAVAGGAR